MPESANLPAEAAAAEVRDIKTILQEAYDDLKAKGAL